MDGKEIEALIKEYDYFLNEAITEVIPKSKRKIIKVIKNNFLDIASVLSFDLTEDTTNANSHNFKKLNELSEKFPEVFAEEKFVEWLTTIIRRLHYKIINSSNFTNEEKGMILEDAKRMIEDNKFVNPSLEKYSDANAHLEYINIQKSRLKYKERLHTTNKPYLKWQGSKDILSKISSSLCDSGFTSKIDDFARVFEKKKCSWKKEPKFLVYLLDTLYKSPYSFFICENCTKNAKYTSTAAIYFYDVSLNLVQPRNYSDLLYEINNRNPEKHAQLKKRVNDLVKRATE